MTDCLHHTQIQTSVCCETTQLTKNEHSSAKDLGNANHDKAKQKLAADQVTSTFLPVMLLLGKALYHQSSPGKVPDIIILMKVVYF